MKTEKSKISAAMKLIGSFLRRIFRPEHYDANRIKPMPAQEEDKKEEEHKIIEKIEPKEKMEIEEEQKSEIIRFDESKLIEVKELVANDFNVLVYGIGSKFALLKTMATDHLNEIGDVIFVNGASATVNMKQILSKVIQLVCRKGSCKPKMVPSRLSDQIVWLEDRLEKLSKNDPTVRIVLVIHCLDVIMGIDPMNRDSISKLAEQQRVQLVASIENSRCFTLWDSISLSALHFVYIHMDTYLPYMKEECYFLDQYTRNEEVKEKGLAFILKSLTDRHRYFLFKINISQ